MMYGVLFCLSRLSGPDGSEVNLALLMDVECPDNPFVSAFPPWLIALSLALPRGELIWCPHCHPAWVDCPLAWVGLATPST